MNQGPGSNVAFHMYAILLHPRDQLLRLLDQSEPTPFIGIVYVLESGISRFHVGFAEPSRN